VQDFRSKDGLYNIIPDQNSTPPSSVPSTPSRSRHSSEDYFPPSQSSVTPTSSRRASSSPIPKLKGQDLFDTSVWRDSHTTEVFYRFIASLRQKIRDEVKDTSPTHKFIRSLRDGGRLMRCYTQNIDGLETREGLSMKLEDGKGTRRRFMKKIWEFPRPSELRNSEMDGGCEVVPLHGDLEMLRCSLCQETCPWSNEATDIFLNGAAPECSECASKSYDRQEKGKRGVAIGSLRPNIVLYGEEHPSNQYLAPLVPFDLGSGPEILIIMGTSLKVHGLQRVVREFAKKIHTRKDGKGRVVFINRTRPAGSVWENVIDSYIAMDCDDWVNDLKRRRDDLFLRQGELSMDVTKPAARKRKSTDDSPTPSKRAKIVVDIPSKPEIVIATPHKAETTKEISPCSLMTPPPSHRKSSIQCNDGTSIPELPTAYRSDNVSFKQDKCYSLFKGTVKGPRRPQPSPLRNTWKRFARDDKGGKSPERPRNFSPIEERRIRNKVYEGCPQPSPLRNTWKPFARDDSGNKSPQRPQNFSPIEERRTKKKVYEDPGLEIDESPDEDPEAAGSVIDTPTKNKALRPRSDSSLNFHMVRNWATHDAKQHAEHGEDICVIRRSRRGCLWFD
jgi:NAD-dependent SIR2 family protein deacetylase